MKELHEQPFSVLIDEWSDIHVRPHLGVVVLFFSKTAKAIKSRFLGIVELTEDTTSQKIFYQLSKLLKQYNLSFQNLIGYASDGASVVSGQHNSVWSRVHEQAPNAFQFKCVCHSLDKVVSSSFDVLPSRIAVLIKKIPSWFSKSFKRKREYSQLYAEFSHEEESTLNPFISVSATR